MVPMCAALVLAACQPGQAPQPAPGSALNQQAIQKYQIPASEEPQLSVQQVTELVRKKIKYVFVLYQENRSFDSYFGTYPGAEGIFSHKPEETPGFTQPLIDTDGTTRTIEPFRIGPVDYAADTDDVDHSHPALLAKMDFQSGAPKMDHFALVEEHKYMKSGEPSLLAKQMGELTMAYEDCDTIPLLWRFASRFVLFDHVFQEMTGPSTLGNLAIIAAQTGQTQWALHPNEGFSGNGSQGSGVPVMDDANPFWGSPLDDTPKAQKMPVNPRDFERKGTPNTQINLTFATLPLTLQGQRLKSVASHDRDPSRDLADVQNDIPYISKREHEPMGFGWYEEGYGSGKVDMDDGPEDAYGLHAAYVTHHNGPQYFGYIANNPQMRGQLHGLQAFFDALKQKTLPEQGGVFFMKGGYQNPFNLHPADPDRRVQENFKGDDDHPAYSDAQISEALLARAVNAIAASRYWPESAIIITWDDSEGDYDHVPPTVRAKGPDGSVISDGPRVPLILISPYARTHYVAHSQGNQASVVKFVDKLFNLLPLALLPDEQRGSRMGEKEFGQKNLGPQDAITPGVGDLTEAFSPARLLGKAEPLPASYVEIPDSLLEHLPQETGYGCRDLGIITTDPQLHVVNKVPSDFNPRPKTTPTL
ncbi:MAG TPA: alkaline phosphatase family protein [Terriglobia bacterium]|nr:alkaline phosphatase family protein [Terriglobia bacterium]